MGAWAGNARSRVGALALLATAVCCTHEEAPPQRARQSTPTFESNVEMGTNGTPREKATSPLDGTTGPGSVEEPGWAPPEKPPPVDQRGLCDSIGRDATLRMEPIQGGAAVVITPRLASNVETLRGDASTLQQAIAASPRSGAPDAHGCSLFDLAAAGAHVAFVDGDSKVELQITSNDPTAIRALRARVREFVKDARDQKGR